jgi:hemerythrin-like domain-containing protein
MGWRKILEREHRLVLEVADAADLECEHEVASGQCRVDLVGDILGFFRYFNDGLHDPKEEDLLFARCRKRGMTNDDEPLEQMECEHEWCRAELDALQEGLRHLDTGDRGAVLSMADRLHAYTDMIRTHIEVEESVFFDMAQHYLTEDDRRQLTEEFESVHYDEVEEGVQEYWEDLAHRLLAEERQVV